jgi:hypothetical protein
MATAPTVTRPTRQDRALGILVRDEVIPVDDRPGFFTVRDTATGSGESHLTTANSCTCRDHIYGHGICKHRRAVITETYRLKAYAAAWDRACSTWAARCPECGAELETTVSYVGGRGYSTFLVCTEHVEHRAVRV